MEIEKVFFDIGGHFSTFFEDRSKKVELCRKMLRCLKNAQICPEKYKNIVKCQKMLKCLKMPKNVKKKSKNSPKSQKILNNVKKMLMNVEE